MLNLNQSINQSTNRDIWHVIEGKMKGITSNVCINHTYNPDRRNRNAFQTHVILLNSHTAASLELFPPLRKNAKRSAARVSHAPVAFTSVNAHLWALSHTRMTWVLFGGSRLRHQKKKKIRTEKQVGTSPPQPYNLRNKNSFSSTQRIFLSTELIER